MRPPVFLADPAVLERDAITLAGAEGRHATTVRRLSVGERADEWGCDHVEKKEGAG